MTWAPSAICQPPYTGLQPAALAVFMKRRG
jgi:hypothetical protein